MAHWRVCAVMPKPTSGAKATERHKDAILFAVTGDHLRASFVSSPDSRRGVCEAMPSLSGGRDSAPALHQELVGHFQRPVEEGVTAIAAVAEAMLAALADIVLRDIPRLLQRVVERSDGIDRNALVLIAREGEERRQTAGNEARGGQALLAPEPEVPEDDGIGSAGNAVKLKEKHA